MNTTTKQKTFDVTTKMFQKPSNAISVRSVSFSLLTGGLCADLGVRGRRAVPPTPATHYILNVKYSDNFAEQVHVLE